MRYKLTLLAISPVIAFSSFKKVLLSTVFFCDFISVFFETTSIYNDIKNIVALKQLLIQVVIFL